MFEVEDWAVRVARTPNESAKIADDSMTRRVMTFSLLIGRSECIRASLFDPRCLVVQDHSNFDERGHPWSIV